MNAKGLATPRTAKAGHEAEFAVVSAQAMVAVEQIDEDGRGDELLNILTDPRKPGLFAPSLECLLRYRAQSMIDTILLLHRLRRIADGPPRSSNVSARDLPALGVDGTEKEIREWSMRGLTTDEAKRVCAAARETYNRIQQERKQNRLLSDHCPKCGGACEGCEADGSWRRLNAKTPPAYRICNECAEITPNAPQLRVVDLSERRRR